MKFLYVALVIFACICVSEGRVYQLIDAFDDNQGPLVVQVRVGGDTTYPYDWWSPYYEPGDAGGEPGFLFFDTDAAWGGQRDNVLGYESASSRNSVAVLSIVGDAASVAFPLQYAGGAYFQWDGDDTGTSGTAFPGARLNNDPGIGSGEPTVANPDGQSIDFTFGGRAAGIYIEIKADHFVNYFFDAIDVNGFRNELAFDVDPPNGNTAVPFFWRFDDQGWDNPLYDWTATAGFQVRIFTFAGTSTENAVDSEFRLLRILGYEVSGSVVTDCLCDSVIDSVVVGAQVNLFRRGAPIALATTLTDANGDYIFGTDQLDDGDYTVCLDDLAAERCPSSSGCIDFTLANFVDVINLDFFLTVASTLNIPEDQDLNCGDCTDPSCTGFATASGCSGGNVQINDFTDSVTTSNFGCVVTIRRTWVDPDTNESGVQTITLTDSDPPQISPSASDRTQICEDASTYANFISTQAGADATDCTSFTWTASANSQPIRCDSETVTFTATDPCGQFSRTTATYTVTDNVDPVYDVPASDDSAECDLKGSTATSALNQWVSTRGGSQVSDNCATSGQLVFSNDFVGVTNGCGDSDIVTFTVADGCGNTAVTTGTFTISDNTAPVISPEAADQTAVCSRTGADNTAFQNWLSNRGGARASDNCIADDNDLTWSHNFLGSTVGGEDTCREDNTVTFTVTDPCGFTDSTTATFTVSDTTRPVISPQASNRSVQCDGSGNVSDYNDWINSNGGAVATDSCTSVTFDNDSTGPPLDCGDSRTVTFSATDDCGNGPVVTTATFSLIDTNPPFFVDLPQPSSAECDSTAPSQYDAWLANNAFATIDDACSSVGLFITNNDNGTGLPAGCNNSRTVTFFANDACGNISGGQTASFTISDNTDPTIGTPASNQNIECNVQTNQAAYQTFISTRGGATATDVCGTISWSNDGPVNVPTGCSTSTTVTFVANDGCGNVASTTASFNINDNTPPTLNTPAADMTVECNGNGNTNDLNNWLNNRGGASASDTCGAVTWSNDFVELSGGCTSFAEVTFTGCDACSQCVFTTATFTVSDTRGPVINPQATSQTVECDPSSNDNVFQTYLDDNGGARATDICNQGSLVWSTTFQSSPFGCDSEEVLFTVTDPCGFTATTSSTFTILDTIAPTFTTPPSDISVECNGSGNVNDFNSWVNNFGGGVAEDVCAVQLIFTNNAPSTGPVGCGNQVVSFTVEDECSNSVSRSATYRVVDTGAPTIVTPASPQTVECDSSTNLTQLQTWLDNNGNAVASDTCYGNNLSWTNNFVSLNVDDCRQVADVTFSVSDPCGQTALTTARFTIDDTTSPTITTEASAAFFECNAQRNDGEVANYISSRGGATATDSCSSVTWSNDFVSQPEECSGPVNVQFTATDRCGNFAVTVGSVEIDDTIAPTFSNFPNNRVIRCDESDDPSQTGRPTAGDTCDTDVEATWSDVTIQEPDERFCPGDFIITRTWSAVDDCGNLFTRDQIITITLPVGECIPTPCPPCADQICCESSIEPVPCNPVACNPVPCVAPECESVPCLPVVCQGSGQTPIFDDDDDDFVGVPVQSPRPQPCEPVYVYVFDDDEYNNEPFQPQVVETTSSAGTMQFAFFLLALLMIVF